VSRRASLDESGKDHPAHSKWPYWLCYHGPYHTGYAITSPTILAMLSRPLPYWLCYHGPYHTGYAIMAPTILAMLSRPLSYRLCYHGPCHTGYAITAPTIPAMLSWPLPLCPNLTKSGQHQYLKLSNVCSWYIFNFCFEYAGAR
jgi:hypothetical protein